MDARGRLAFLLAALLCGSGALAAADDGADASGSSQENAQPRDKQGAPIDTTGLKSGCFYPRDVSNWDALNREYLIVYAPGKSRPYLLKIAPPSISLRSVATIGFAGRDRICGRPGERLVIDRSRGSNFIIMDVWRLDAATASRLIENKQARDSAKVEAAAKSPGAVVETDIKVDGAEDGGDSDRTGGAAGADPD